MTRFYGQIQKVEPQEDGSLIVTGIASSEAVDSDGEVITADAIRGAIPDYLKFGTGALREMHSLSAAGCTIEAAVDAAGVTRIVARVVDPVAVTKVRAGVYKGFSIGGRATARDPANRRRVTALALTEISLVDRPANPDAVFDCWKSASDPEASAENMVKAALSTPWRGDRGVINLVRGGQQLIAAAERALHPDDDPKFRSIKAALANPISQGGKNDD